MRRLLTWVPRMKLAPSLAPLKVTPTALKVSLPAPPSMTVGPAPAFRVSLPALPSSVAGIVAGAVALVDRQRVVAGASVDGDAGNRGDGEGLRLGRAVDDDLKLAELRRGVVAGLAFHRDDVAGVVPVDLEQAEGVERRPPTRAGARRSSSSIIRGRYQRPLANRVWSLVRRRENRFSRRLIFGSFQSGLMPRMCQDRGQCRQEEAPGRHRGQR